MRVRRDDGGVAEGVVDLAGLEIVRGGAAPEELAAVLAVIATRAERAGPDRDGYQAWRAQRLAAVARGEGSGRRRA
jgi:Acyl-CoA carboxylase epsilon subunit